MISVVIPLYNENVLVNRLLEEVFFNLKSLSDSFEVVCVDDGSTDSTLLKLLEFKKNNKQLKVVSLSRNFGLQAALTAGLEYANGEYVIMMDGDFQDPPEMIPDLYNKVVETNVDIVTAVRESRNERFSKKLYINIFHKIFSSITEEKQISNAGNFCIMKRNAHQAILKFAERNRYLPGIRSFIGFKQDIILFERPERLGGIAKMSRKKLFALAADAIYSFSKWPIKVCLYLGIIGIFVFLGAIIYTVASKFLGFAPTGWSSTFLAISFFGSVQLTFLGIIGEYIYRIFKEVQNRPIYFVKEFYD
ncbi:glycosyltransferase family 2 protein [Maribellus maritimus]|uniref:glycosyltransferase family 2 protein n=1 Tax=Maribellus maritimus TaxID=2870838 RepID=UPI001EEA2765|nr:glycosyltransferase family 2 protein [Maribellus maritimus]MCG6187435.1 glycosyltransferase family 2 protein [Maribellus maritimus]